MKVEKIKGIIPDYHEGVGPSNCTTLGIKIGDMFISFGKYYAGPHMINEHAEIMDKMESFIDECVDKFENSTDTLDKMKKDLKTMKTALKDIVASTPVKSHEDAINIAEIAQEALNNIKE